MATLTGEASHDIVAKALTALRNLDHRGAAGAEVELRRRRRHPAPGPRRLPARGRRLRPPGPGRVRRRHGVPRGRRRRGRQDPSAGRGARRGRGGPDRPRLARRTGRPRLARRDRPRRDAVVQPAVRRRSRCPPDRDGARAARVLPAQAGRARDRGLLRLAERAHPALQGHAHHRPARPVLPRPRRRADRLGAGRRALPLLDQHLPELAAGPPVPLHRPQRRDQHRDGQPQLDAGPRGAARLRPDPGRPRPPLPDLYAGRLRLRELRRGPRAAPHGRPDPAPRGPDDDPRGLGEPPGDGPAAAGVLRVPLHR